MIQKPFDNIPAVNTLIRLYKEGYTTPELARYFETNKGHCLKTLRLHNVPIRSIHAQRIKEKDMEFEKKRYSDKPVSTVRTVILPQFQKGKYDALFEEKQTVPLNYDALLTKHGVKRPKGFFGKL